jgi:hypothetical protein
MFFAAGHALAQVAIFAQEFSSSDSGDDSIWILFLGPAAGIAFYALTYLYYRNTDKSHTFEYETSVEADPIHGAEQKIDSIRGTQESTTRGHNESNYRQRVQRIL